MNEPGGNLPAAPTSSSSSTEGCQVSALPKEIAQLWTAISKRFFRYFSLARTHTWLGNPRAECERCPIPRFRFRFRFRCSDSKNCQLKRCGWRRSGKMRPRPPPPQNGGKHARITIATRVQQRRGSRQQRITRKSGRRQAATAATIVGRRCVLEPNFMQRGGVDRLHSLSKYKQSQLELETCSTKAPPMTHSPRSSSGWSFTPITFLPPSLP